MDKTGVNNNTDTHISDTAKYPAVPLVPPKGAVMSLAFGCTDKIKLKKRQRRKISFLFSNMATETGLSAAVPLSPSDVPVFPPVSLSAEAAPFTPLAADGWRLLPSDAEKEFSRCATRLRGLRGNSGQLKEELNLLFDQLLSENYNRTFEPSVNVRPAVKNTHSVTGSTFNRLRKQRI